jgi:hypothetical protein
VEIDFHLAPASELITAGGSWTGSPWSAFKVVHIQKKSTTDVYSQFRGKPWNYCTYDYQTIKDFALPTGVTTELDLTAFDGSSAGVYFNPVTDTNIAANDFYTITSKIDRMEAFINSASYLQLTSNMSSISTEASIQWLARCFRAASGQSLSGGYLGPFIPFGGSLEPASDSTSMDTAPKYEGSANMRDFTRFTVQIRNNNSDDVTTDALNVRYAEFTIIDGDLRRKK